MFHQHQAAFIWAFSDADKTNGLALQKRHQRLEPKFFLLKVDLTEELDVTKTLLNAKAKKGQGGIEGQT